MGELKAVAALARVARAGIVAAVFVAGAACLFARQNVAVPEVATRLDMAEFVRLRGTNDVFVVDVRSVAAYRSGHIPGAINLPMDELDSRAAAVARTADRRMIVAYCSCPDEHASALAALAFARTGAKRTAALVGGFPAWIAQGGAVEREADPSTAPSTPG